MKVGQSRCIIHFHPLRIIITEMVTATGKWHQAQRGWKRLLGSFTDKVMEEGLEEVIRYRKRYTRSKRHEQD